MRTCLSDSGSMVVVFVSDEEPELYTTAEFVSMYDEDALPERETLEKSSIESAEAYADYWFAAIELVNAWAGYQAKRKLLANYLCDETRHRVERVIVESYRNNPNRLKRQTYKLYEIVDEELRKFNNYCRFYKVEPVDTMWIRIHLQNYKDYNKLRGKCQRMVKSGKFPVSLRELAI